MAYTNKKILVSKIQNIKVTYIKKNFLIFSWYEQIKSDSMWKDLVINTLEDYDRIIVNWKPLPTDK
jgi:hypothetical protein